MQAVIVDGTTGGLRAGMIDATENAHCIGNKTDEKLYYGLSHPVRPEGG